MRKWEDIVRDKMEEPDGALPEGVFAEFQARLSGAAPAITRKHIRLLWVVATATAAALAAVLFIRQPEGTAGGIRIEKFPADPVAAIADSAIANEMVQSVRSFDRALSSNPAQRVPVRIREVLEVPEKDLAENSSPAVKDTLPPERQKPDPDDNPSVTTEISPFIPRNAGAGTVDVEVRPATGMIVGSGLLAAVVAPAFWLGKPAGNVQVIPNEEYGIGIDDQPLFVTSDRPDHCFPIRLGMSARIPVTDRLYVSTGLGYANYQSTFRFLSYGETKQAVHYLGVPLRMDWAFASGRWFDLYVGAGVMGDICLGATLGGERLPKDPPSFSLLGTGGFQVNVTRHVGIYVEPELSWRIPSDKQRLLTYRSEHPLMFSVAAGLRFNIISN